MKIYPILFTLLIFTGLQGKAGNVEQLYRFTNPTVNNPGEYQIVTFQNTLLTALPGQPALPYSQVKLMLPPGESAEKMEIFFSGEITLPGRFNLCPQQEVRPLSAGYSGIFLKDKSVYDKNAIYPEDPKGKLITAFLNGYSFALSSFTPVRYNPVTGKISYYTSARIVVTTVPDPKAVQALANITTHHSNALKLADNAEMMNNYPKMRQTSSDDYEILIICTAAFSGDFAALRSAYLKEGLRSQVATTEYIASSMTGIDLQEKIRNYIIHEYQTYGIEHVLLAGDAEIIPFRGFYCYVQSGGGYSDSNIPADIYYSGLDGNWNTNNDALWAEPGEDDLLPDVSVGRMPFSNLDELNHMLNKSIGYQFTPVANEFRDVLLAGEYMNAAPYLTYGSYYLELLIGLHADNNYTTNGIPLSYSFDKLYDETSSWSGQTLINHLNLGRPMLYHAGHSNMTYVMRLYNSDITNQNFSGLNGVTHNFTLIYSHGCNCGAFDYSDCIAEKMVTIDNFAAAFVGNTRYGWFNEGTTEGPSAHLNREFVDALCTDKLNRIGEAHKESKIATAPYVTAPGQWEPGAMRWCFYDCTVLGDPAMAVFTDNPINIRVSYPDNVTSGSSSVSVNVTSESTPVEGLTCVILEDGILLGKNVTGTNGNTIIQLSPSVTNPEHVQLVVSGYNCTPATYNLVAKTYVWKVASGNWKSAASWSPLRSEPADNDILVFDGNVQPVISVTSDFISTQKIGKLRILNNASVSFTTAGVSKTLNIGTPGIPAPNFEVTAGSALSITTVNPIMINILSGFTGSISGTILFQQAAHRLTANSTNGITFRNGAAFTAGINFLGNAFGISASNSVVFSNGSTYIHQAGENPFGATYPNTVVSFQPGSLYKFIAPSGAPDFSGRTYSNIEINSASAGLNSITGSNMFTADDLIVTNGNCGIKLSGEIFLKGNISTSQGAVLSFAPPSGASVHLNGSNPQTISGQGTITCNSNSTIKIENPAGITLSTSATLHDLTIISGSFTISPGAILTTTGMVTLKDP